MGPIYAFFAQCVPLHWKDREKQVVLEVCIPRRKPVGDECRNSLTGSGGTFILDLQLPLYAIGSTNITCYGISL